MISEKLEKFDKVLIKKFCTKKIFLKFACLIGNSEKEIASCRTFDTKCVKILILEILKA